MRRGISSLDGSDYPVLSFYTLAATPSSCLEVLSSLGHIYRGTPFPRERDLGGIFIIGRWRNAGASCWLVGTSLFTGNVANNFKTAESTQRKLGIGGRKSL